MRRFARSVWTTASALACASACGGEVLGAGDAGNHDASVVDQSAKEAAAVVDAPVDGSDVVSCATACIANAGGAGGDCPVLLLYECLRGPCGDPASTTLCAEATGAPPPASIVRCAGEAFPTCTDPCQQDSNCKAFVACIESCI